MSRAKDLEVGQHLAQEGDYDNAYVLAARYLRNNPNDVPWLTVMAYCLLGGQKPEVAYHVCKRVTELEPKEPSGWMNLGMAANDLWLEKEAERYYRRGLKLSTTDKQKAMFCVNLSSVLVDNGRFEDARKYCEQALELNPDSTKAKANLGFCQLATGEWSDGWQNYRACIGSEWRKRVQYNDEPLWNGEQGTIVVSGEQGLGDEIVFASMLPDMLDWAKESESEVIIECEPRLRGLFQRSFPGVAVHGTRGMKEITWNPTEVDYSIPSGQIGEYFRATAESFDRKPFLVPCPDRELMWRALFESKDKPVIGIAWSGGIPKTGAKHRRVTLEQLLPLFRSVDAHWVSLQYRSSTEEIDTFRAKYPDVDLAEYPHATLSSDYDDTAAMIAAMDAVVGVPTAAVHTAGCLGVRTVAMCARMKCWKFHSGLPFHPLTAMIEHKGDWDSTIDETASHLRDLCLIEYSSDTIRDSLSPITSHNSRLSETPQSLSA